jgi:hypothetical protein
MEFDLTYLIIRVRMRRVVALISFERRLTHCSRDTKRKILYFPCKRISALIFAHQPNNSGNFQRFFLNSPKLRTPFLCKSKYYVVKEEVFLLMRLTQYLSHPTAMFYAQTLRKQRSLYHLMKSGIPPRLLLYVLPG